LLKKAELMKSVKSIIKRLISITGYNLQRKRFIEESDGSMASGLKRLKYLQVDPSIIIDLGAAQGTWTLKSLEVWPSAKYELVEPLYEQTINLNKLKELNSNLDYHLAVAGEAIGEVGLNVSPDLDGSGIYGSQAANVRKVPVITLDEIIKDTDGSILIKFDTHGYEVPILNGSTDTLKRTKALIIEVYGFRISPTCLLFHELTTFLDGLGFRLVDIVDIMRRPGDQVFWQADAFYVRKDNPVFVKNSYA
jgi:FkbM family methyltransferase